jgi:glycosyltransferase involved in cell wall biosynthesis
MVSDAVAECEWDEFRNSGVRIRNWIDAVHFRPPDKEERLAARESLGLSPSTKVLVSVGNCNKAKNHSELLRAVNILENIQNLVYLHIGNEQENFPERALAQQLGIEEKTRFCGSQPDIRTYLWACDLFVMPSLHEGLAIAPLEAIASECSVILSRVPGLQDLKALAPHVCFTEPDAQSIATEVRGLLEEPHPNEAGGFNQDSTAIRSHFPPREGVRIIRETLYGLPHLDENPSE